MPSIDKTLPNDWVTVAVGPQDVSQNMIYGQGRFRINVNGTTPATFGSWFGSQLVSMSLADGETLQVSAHGLPYCAIADTHHADFLALGAV